jgi:chorismate-pyruvate lyase
MRPAVTIAVLHRKLLSCASATAVLEEVFGASVSIRRLSCDALALSPTQREKLRPTQSAPACHRRVMLLAGGRPVSEADLWYVPSRLWPGMEKALRNTELPFGKVIAPMQPVRETLASRICAEDESVALEHEAVLRDQDGLPIALVAERYYHLV